VTNLQRSTTSATDLRGWYDCAVALVLAALLVPIGCGGQLEEATSHEEAAQRHASHEGQRAPAGADHAGTSSRPGQQAAAKAGTAAGGSSPSWHSVIVGGATATDGSQPRQVDPEAGVPAAGSEIPVPSDSPPGVSVTGIARGVTYYATFQSHNQRVAAAAGNYFIGYLLSRDDDGGGGQWRIARSTDAGASWKTLYTSAKGGSAPPALAVDPEGNLYAASVDFLDPSKPAYLTKWRAGDYARVARAKYRGFGGSMKYTLVYDECRGQLIYASYDGRLLTANPSAFGRWSHRRVMNFQGQHAHSQYPHLSMVGCQLYHGWTTAHSSTSYYSIHAAKSPDGGKSWFKLNAEASDGSDAWWSRNARWRLPSPFQPDDSSPTATQVSYKEENAAHTWLSNMIVHGGKIHFAYNSRHHGNVYTRFDDGPGYRELTQYGSQGAAGLVGLMGAFFVTHNQSLYLVGRDDQGHIAVIRSDDNGSSWYRFASSEKAYGNVYAVSGSPRVTPRGDIVGMFTDQHGEQGDAYFFKVSVTGNPPLP
jgi:hypothetical protein